MSKRRLTLHVRIPPYCHPRNSWRRELHKAIVAAQQRHGVLYEAGDILELEIRLHMQSNDLKRHNVDNRLKDVMDALQGRAGGSKGKRNLMAVIRNDVQIYRIVIEKTLPPAQSRGLGHLTVRRLRRTR